MDTIPKVTSESYWLILFLSLLAFGLLVIFLEIRIIAAAGKGWDVRSTRIVGITLVIVATLSLLVITAADEKIAPVVAVLGSVAGYLFGRTGD